MNLRSSTALLSASLLLAAASCSSGGGGAPAQSTQPTAVTVFPFDGVLTDAAELTVRGTASDPRGRPIGGVTVAGVTASSSDGFANWKAVVPLSLGLNKLGVQIRDADGDLGSEVASVGVARNEVLVGFRGAIALDPTRNVIRYWKDQFTTVSIADGTATTSAGSGTELAEPELVVADPARDRVLASQVINGSHSLWAIDATGARTALSGATRGTGPSLEAIGKCAIDEGNHRALCPDLAIRAITAVDLTTGDRSTISSDTPGRTRGSGPTLRNPVAVDLDQAAGRLLVADSVLATVFSVDLTTGNRSILSDLNTGTGEPMLSASDIAFDPVRLIAIVTDSSPRNPRVVSVDVRNGDRTTLSGPGVGDGPELSGPRSVSLDLQNDRVLVADSNDGRDAILAIDIESGDRTVIFESRRGTGPFFDDTRDVALDVARNRLLVSDDGSDGKKLVAIDIDTGNRITLTDATTGAGPEITNFESVTVDTANDRVLLIDRVGSKIVGVDPETGDRTVLAENGVGTGPDFENPSDIAFDPATKTALVTDSRTIALVAVDLATGSRTIVSSNTVGSGPMMQNPQDVEIDAANRRAIVGDDNNPTRLLWVDLETGDRTVLADAVTGTGPVLVRADRIALDLTNDRALVLTRANDEHTLYSVDLTSGDRTVISSKDRGLGPLIKGGGREDLVVSTDGSVAFYMNDGDSNFLFAFDLQTGDRFVFSK